MATKLQIPGICGWFGDPRDSVPQQVLGRQVASQPWHGSFIHHSGEKFATAAAGGSIWTSGDGLTVTLVGAPYLKNTRFQVGDEQSDLPANIGAAYRESGGVLLDALGGEFSLAIFDEKARSGLIAVDRFARRPVYWSRAGRRLIFGGSADAVLAHADKAANLDRQGIYHYLFFHMVPAPGTIYKSVYKLRAGSRLMFNDGDIEVQRYWTPAFAEGRPLSAESGGEQFLGLVEQAIQRQHTDQDTQTDIGAFLSGGLDSSTVAGVLSRQRPAADSYSIGFDAKGYDEIGFARIVVDHFGLNGHEYYVTPEDVLAALPEVVAAYDDPFGNSSALPALYCARLAKADGKQRLLAGDGGDELFAGNARYLKQQVFERYRRVPLWFRRAFLEPAVFALSRKLPLVGKARSYIEQALIPLPDRLQTYNFLERLGIEAVVHPDLLASVDRDRPRRLEREIYHAPENASTLNRMLYLDWHHTLADNDLRKVSRMCELAGIEVSYPLLDDEVVEFSMSVPSSQKIHAGRLRDYYKKAMRPFLPAEILDKKKHGFGLPFGVWTASHAGLKELVQENLGRLGRRQIIRDDFLRKALDLHQHGHAAYYGELIWVLTVLEMWLTSRHIEP